MKRNPYCVKAPTQKSPYISTWRNRDGVHFPL